MPPVNHGFPPPAPSRGSSSDGATGPGAIPDDMLKREQEYQEALEKRNKLLLDPNPVRAMEALRAATAKALEEEKRFGQAIKDRLGLTDRAGLPGGVQGGRVIHGDGVTAPFVQPAGPIVPPPPQVPQNARQMAEQRQAMTEPTPPPAPGPTFGQMRGAAMGTVGAIGRGVGTINGAVDAANAPFVDNDTRFFNTVNSLDPTGAVGSLRRLQISMQRYGSGMTREEQFKKEQQNLLDPQMRTLPLERFRLDWDVQRLKAASLLTQDERGRVDVDPGSWMPEGTRKGFTEGLARMPDVQYPTVGDRSRDTVRGEQRLRQSYAELPAQRQLATETRELKSQEVAMEGLIALRERYDKERRDAQSHADFLKTSADLEPNAVKKSGLYGQAAAEAQKALGLQRLAMEAEDRLWQARETYSYQQFKVRSAEQEIGRAKEAVYAEREQVAAGQSVRTIAMGPAERVQGQAMLQLVQQMKEAGNDLSMLPSEVWDAASRAAPETTRKLMEEAGAKRIAIDRDSGAIPKDEVRDLLPEIRQLRDEQSRQNDTATLEALKGLFRDLFQSINDVRSRDAGLLKVLESQIKQFEFQSYYQGNAGKVPG